MTDTQDKKTVAKETVRVTGNLPKDLYDRLYNEHRFDVRKEKGDFMEHVFSEYERVIVNKENDDNPQA